MVAGKLLLTVTQRLAELEYGGEVFEIQGPPKDDYDGPPVKD